MFVCCCVVLFLLYLSSLVVMGRVLVFLGVSQRVEVGVCAHAPVLDAYLAEVVRGPEEGAHGHEEEGGVQVAEAHDQHEELAHAAEADQRRGIHAEAGEEGGERGHEHGRADPFERVVDAQEALVVVVSIDLHEAAHTRRLLRLSPLLLVRRRRHQLLLGRRRLVVDFVVVVHLLDKNVTGALDEVAMFDVVHLIDVVRGGGAVVAGRKETGGRCSLLAAVEVSVRVDVGDAVVAREVDGEADAHDDNDRLENAQRPAE